MAYQLYLLQSSLLALAALQCIFAVQFDVNNKARTTPGGARFDREIGVEYAKQTMATTTNFIWKMFQQNNGAERRNYQQVFMVIENYTGWAAIAFENTINVSAVNLQNLQGNVKWEFTSLIYHEMTHVWQWFGNEQAPVGLIEGIADYTVLKANYNPPGFAKPGMGERWDQGYDFTARFLEYCEGLRPGFVAALNKKMKDTYNGNYFVELLGKPVDQLWREYKAKYGHRVESSANEHTNLSRRREYKDRYGGKAGYISESV